MVWAPGQSLYGGRYRIERQLGQGGFGITYLARDKDGEPFAIKTLKDEVVIDPDRAAFLAKYQQDFRDEALRLSLCRHPHIVQMENSFHEGQFPCIVMEYIQGEDLGHRVNRQGVLSQTEALLYIRQIGEALSFIHNKGLLHRDVKPKNILVRAGKSEAVLIDFGIAREFIPEVTLTHTQAISNGFAPVEQYAPRARRGEYTDVYALAATLYYLLTATVPVAAFVRAARIPLEPPQQLNPSISNKVNQAILAGMGFEPESRPQSVQEWLKFLEENELENIDSLQEPPQAATLSREIPLASISNYSVAITLPLPDEISSSVGIDYSNLRDLLADGKWQEADRETAALMPRLSGREREGRLRIEDIEQFPGEDIRTIDALWVNHSNGRFGFSVQRRIWESLGGTKDGDRESWDSFCDRVGWRVNGNPVAHNHLPFSLNAPEGNLPGLLVWRWFVWDGSRGFASLMSRLESCNIHFLPSDDLSSAVGADYSKLRDLLADGKWKEADEETYKRMLEVARRETEGWLRTLDIDRFFCEDLRTIDQLWVKYSKGRFGFSVQKRIYESLGDNWNYDEKIWNSFGDRVGWQVNNEWLSYSKLCFTLNAPLGHLPRWCGVAAWRRFVFVCLGLFSRIEICTCYQNF